MKVLIFGPSGSGKTYTSQALRDSGINAWDADDIIGLSAWYDKHGQKVTEPKTAEEAINHRYSFLWSKSFLTRFLSRFSEVYVFGGSGNIWNMFDFFDRVYFLKVDVETQKNRILNAANRNSLLDFTENDLVIWGEWFEKEAKKRNILFIDATLSPDEIYNIISQK